MSKFHLLHCVPSPRMHGPHGYREIIESIHWGLEQLGHEVTYSLNAYQSASTNIVFGAQMLPLEVLKQLPQDTIVYNFEQGRGLDRKEVRPEVYFIAENFSIWDYSAANMDMWKSLGNETPKLVPVGYAPVLSRIPKAKDQDIEIFLYGSVGQKRLNVFQRLSEEGYRVLFASGLYGTARDALIARSKIVLNINFIDRSRIFEVVRVSYLLANRKAVVAVLDPDTAIESDFSRCVRSTNPAEVVAACEQLLSNDTLRAELEDSGYEVFAARDIRKILDQALS
jgi:hypothetical protein